MSREDRRLLFRSALAAGTLLALAGFLLRAWVSETLADGNKVHLAFLDLALRDRSRFLAGTLSERWDREQDWPEDLSDVLTRNHADYNRDIFMQVFTLDGGLVAASSNTPPGITLAPAAVPGQGWSTHDSATPDGRPLRLVTYPVHTGQGTGEGLRFHGYAQAGLLQPDTERRMERFTRIMAASLVGFGALFLAALRTAVLAAAERARKESEIIQAAQHRFIGDAAHELGTPLAVLRGEIDIALRRERSADDYRAALASCREEIERLSRLSENLLALATADAGQALIHRAPCDAADLARAVCRRFARVAAEKGVTLAVDAPATLPCRADAPAIGQVLGNLISNALRHTPAGDSATLTAAQEGGAIILRVADTGEGIPPAHLPRIFDRFHRVDKARSRAGGGAGLGLAIVRTLVEAHGGTVTVTSELGKGAVFTCRFPADQPPQPSQ
ncbi:MAG: two-component system sensor kinase [Verrucomicrobiales bacterium]|nr:two-component system sensor kinase [Verrucomicrobiales bacterium]